MDSKTFQTAISLNQKLCELQSLLHYVSHTNIFNEDEKIITPYSTIFTEVLIDYLNNEINNVSRKILEL